MALAAKVNDVHLSPEMSSPAEMNDVHLGDLIRAGIEEARVSYKEVAIALGVAPSYLTAMLDGEKPWRLSQLRALPDAIERALVTRYAAVLGLQVIEPSTEARVMGDLLGAIGAVLRTYNGLPAKAGPMLKAEMK